MKDQPSPVLYDTNGLCLEEIVAPLLAWYRQSARILPWRENTAPYRVWVSEIMLQQTRVDTASPIMSASWPGSPAFKPWRRSARRSC
ncbi:MAG: hypothetical protein ACLSB9_11350 [Hydrogeniiclostridium mannosilyticum]